jgi:integrase
MTTLMHAVEAYLSTRRALGFQLRWEGLLLRAFATFLADHGAPHITAALAVQWAQQPAHVQPYQWAMRLRVVRCFARYQAASDPRTEIPAADLLPFRYTRRAPYIYSEGDINALTEAARTLRGERGMRALTYSTLIPLLAVTGLRVGEALRLDRRDCDLQEGVLCVRVSKFRKSRLVPLHASTTAALTRYCAQTQSVFPGRASLLVSARGKRLHPGVVFNNFNSLLRQVGLPHAGDPRRPHLHGLRHTFAVRTLLRWYREDVDVEAQLPSLATYLGHTHIANTYWYLSATPELLQLAAERLDSPLWRRRP